MFDALHSEFVYMSRIGLNIIGQGQLTDFNFAKSPSTRLSVLFFVFLKLPHLFQAISYNNVLYSEQKRSLLHNVLHDSTRSGAFSTLEPKKRDKFEVNVKT